jgi:cardiolipin synthase
MSIKALPLRVSPGPAYERMMTAEACTSVDLSERLTADVAGHRLELIFDGGDRLERLLDLINGAAHSIDIIMYIFEGDAAGTRVLDALLVAAKRGVRVRAVVDSFGSSDTPDSLFAPLRAEGGRVTFFSRRWRSTYLVRNHQKLIVIDNHIAVTGGFNIADDYLSPPRSDCWLDIGLILKGPSVARASQWFEAIHDYTVHDDGKLLMLRRLIREWPIDGGTISWLVGGPTQRLSPWARAVRADLEGARQLDMAMAYFSPGQGTAPPPRPRRAAWPGAVRNGRAVGQCGDDRRIAPCLYGYLLRKTADVWEYQPCKLHMKLIVIDDVVYIGSANFDVRSLFVNVEVMVRIADAGFAEKMRRFLSALQPDCEIITPNFAQGTCELADAHPLDACLVRRRRRRLYGVAKAELRAQRPRSRSLVFPAPEQEAGRDIDPFERIVDAPEMRGEKIAGARAELIDQKRAAGTQHAVRRSCDSGADARGKRREGQARQDIVGMLKAMRTHDFFDVGRRSVNRDEATVANILAQIVDEIFVGVDRDQRRIARHPFEHGAAECAHARPIFDEQLGVLPVHRTQHVADQRRRRRHDRSHHDRMLDEAADKHAPRSEKALEALANPAAQRSFLFLGLRPRIGHVGFRVVAVAEGVAKSARWRKERVCLDSGQTSARV